MKDKSLSELAEMWLDENTEGRGFIWAFAVLKFGRESWRDAIDNARSRRSQNA